MGSLLASSRQSPPRRSRAPPPRPPRRPRRRSSNSRRTPLFLDKMKQNTTYPAITSPPNIGRREIVGAVSVLIATKDPTLFANFVVHYEDDGQKLPGLS